MLFSDKEAGLGRPFSGSFAANPGHLHVWDGASLCEAAESVQMMREDYKPHYKPAWLTAPPAPAPAPAPAIPAAAAVAAGAAGGEAAADVDGGARRLRYSEAELRAYAQRMGHTMVRGSPSLYHSLTMTRRPEPLHASLNEVLKRFMQHNKVCGSVYFDGYVFSLARAAL